jgi:hypothetical protein
LVLLVTVWTALQPELETFSGSLTAGKEVGLPEAVPVEDP